MKFLAIALAHDSERFIKGYPPKGATLLVTPNLEISRLVNLISKRDEIIYHDERVETVNLEIPFDIALIHVDFGQEKRAAEMVLQLSEKGKRSILFGPLPSFWQNQLPDWVDTVVTGSILSAYSEIREDLFHSSLKKRYVASSTPLYAPPIYPIGEKNLFFNNRFQSIQAILGCFCPPHIKSFCPEGLYYGNNILKRNIIETIGEVISLPYKDITLLDEDIASFPEYYQEFFSSVWRYKKYWRVQASPKIFDNPGLIRLLAKSGVRIIFLTEDWFPSFKLDVFNWAPEKIKNQRRQVKLLHLQRMLVGARLSLLYYESSEFNFDQAFSIIDRLDLDFLEIKLYKPTQLDKQKYGSEIEPIQKNYYPMLPSTDPAWLKNRFYAMGSISYRIGKRPFTIGFYNTIFYLIPYSFAYRQNYLEGIAYPP